MRLIRPAPPVPFFLHPCPSHVRPHQLPYVEGSGGSGEKLEYMQQNSEVRALRDEYGADVVLLVGELYDVCGIA